jgi:hypothetical protein
MDAGFTHCREPVIPEELEQIVRGAYDLPLGSHTRETAQLEPPEASQLLKGAEYRLNHSLTHPLQRAAGFRV